MEKSSFITDMSYENTTNFVKIIRFFIKLTMAETLSKLVICSLINFTTFTRCPVSLTANSVIYVTLELWTHLILL